MIFFDFSWHANCKAFGDWNNLLSQIMVAGHRLHVPEPEMLFWPVYGNGWSHLEHASCDPLGLK